MFYVLVLFVYDATNIFLTYSSLEIIHFNYLEPTSW